MAELFQERYRELPIFQRYMDILIRFVPGEEYVLEEIATRLLMASENGLNWDTLCQNCGVLMDDNYEKYAEIEALKEKLLVSENERRMLQSEIASLDGEY